MYKGAVDLRSFGEKGQLWKPEASSSGCVSFLTYVSGYQINSPQAGEGSRFFRACFLISKRAIMSGKPTWGEERRRPIGPLLAWSKNRNETRTSREYLIDDVTMNIGQSSIGTIEAVRKFRMVDTHQVQDGRMKVVTPDWFK